MKNKLILEKILKYVSKILTYTKNSEYYDFINNTILVEACVFNLSQIGELTNKLDKEFKECYTEIPWRTLYGLRNKIVHDYDGVNLVLIWDIVNEDLPELYETLEKLHKSL